MNPATSEAGEDGARRSAASGQEADETRDGGDWSAPAIYRCVLALVALGISLAFVYTLRSVILARDRGLDLSDESLYIVSYRYYQHPELVHTGAAAFFGPVFRMLGWNVPRLRLVKLMLLISSGAVLGGAVVAWARRTFIGVTLGRLESYVVVILVSGGALTAYTWTPQTPSYNDLAAICATVCAACLFHILAGRECAPGWPVALGASLAVATLNKWPAAFAIGVLVGGSFLWSDSWQQFGRRRALRLMTIGAAGCIALLWIAGSNPIRYLTAVADVAQSNAGHGRLTDTYLVPYWTNLREAATAIANSYLPLLTLASVAALVAVRYRTTKLASAAWVACFVAFASVWLIARNHKLFLGGSDNLPQIELALPVVMAASGVTLRVSAMISKTVARDQRKRKYQPTDALLILIPLWLIPALGTDNSLLALAHLTGATSCALAAIAIIAALQADKKLAGAALPLLAGCTMLFVSGVYSGLWRHPYRIVGGLASQTTPVHGIDLFDGMQVDDAMSTLLESLSALSARHSLASLSGFSSFSTPGVAIALGLRQPMAALWIQAPGYVAYQSLYDDRLKLACELHLFAANRLPVVISLDDGAKPAVSGLLERCGVDFANYRTDSVNSPGLPMVPKGRIVVWFPVQPEHT